MSTNTTLNNSNTNDATHADANTNDATPSSTILHHKPLLTFNFKSTKQTTARGCQILPNQFNPVYVDGYHGPSNIESLLIHSGYTCLPWKENQMSFGSKTRLMLSSYMALLKKTGAKQILVHAPKNQQENEMIDYGLLLLSKVNKTLNNDVKTKNICFICVENVYNTMTKSMKTHEELLEFTESLFKKVINHKLDIVIDTAHCFANGLNVDDIIYLLNKYKGHYHFIHLNGNMQQQFKPDRHTLILTDGITDIQPNLIENCEKLMEFISTLTNVVLICEIIYKKYDYWSDLAQKYKLDIITEDEFNNAF